LVGAQKRFLCDILCVGGIAQDAVSDLKNAPLIRSDALAKSLLGIMRFGSGNQRTHARACHASLAPLRIDTAPWPLVQKNSTPGVLGQRAIRTTRKILATDDGRHRRPSPAASSAFPIRRERWVGMP